MKNYLRELLDIEEDEKIPSATVANMKSVKTKNILKTENTVAILYANGNITSGTGSSGIQDKYMVNQIEKLKNEG